MEFIKKNWKNILLVIFIFLTVSMCTGKGNYKRKYEKQVRHTEYVIDSMNTVYSASSRYIDSLRNVISMDEMRISNLEDRVAIYIDQNKKLANKKIEIIVPKDNDEK